MNLDAMSPEELAHFACQYRGNSRSRAAHLFPKNPKGRVRAMKDLVCYARNKEMAMRCRLRGEIQTALRYEEICDRIYSELPDWAKW